MEGNTKENLKMERRMERVLSTGPMVINTLVAGKMANNMELVSGLLQRKVKGKENGLMELVRDG